MNFTSLQLLKTKRAAFNDPDTARARAQRVMSRAWEETNPAKRIALAHETLSPSAQCADAYLLLAEEEADALKRALGVKYFRENAGYFWGLLETRPYMRARQGLAETLWHLKRHNAN